MTHYSDPNIIEQLVLRFFDGETTREEERILEAYFTSGEPLPPNLAPYREMFGWYATGMPESALPEEDVAPVAISATRRGKILHSSPRRWLAWWASAAAVAAVVIGLGWHQHAERLSGLEAMYAESYVVRDGLVVTGPAEIQAELDAALIDMQILDMELDEAQYSLQNNYSL